MSTTFMGDITHYLSAGNASLAAAANSRSSNDNMGLDMTDFLTLMVTELTHQSMDQTADTSDMLNQMVQMQMITAITNLTDASIMTYAASLVGKEVTVGQYDADGNLQEVVGQVTGTGTMGGQQVVFVNDKYYYMSEIMAVGRLPEVEIPEGTDSDKDAVDGTDKVEDSDKTETGGEAPEESDPAIGTGGTETGSEASGETGSEADHNAAAEG